MPPAEALAAAKSHERGRGLEVWGEPELVAIYDDAPAGDGVAYPAWRVRGAGESLLESYTFYIDALSGVVVRYHSNIARLTDQIQGKVTGHATPGLEPDTFSETSEACPNDADEFDLADIWVAAYEDDERETLVAATSTDGFGNYTLEFPTTATVYVFAELKGPGWVVLDGTTAPSHQPAAPVAYAGNPVTAPATGVDLEFNPAPTEKWTAFVNAHKTMSTVVRWLDLEDNAVPVAPLIAHDSSGACDAGFSSFVITCCPDGYLFFAAAGSGCANTAYSTVIAHEYGHFIAWHLMGIDFVQGQDIFQEGFADTLALLVFDTEVVAEDFFGCDEDLRWPRNPAIDPHPQFPRCGGDPCSTQHSRGAHCLGELLPALWRDLRDEIGASDVRDLFLDWIMLAQAPSEVRCDGSIYPDQAADRGTLVEVLQAAGNTSPHIATICDVFFERGITYPGSPPNPCDPDSAGWFCYADCDGSAVLDFWDFLCFQSAFVAGDAYADCDGDEEFTFFDFLCFQNAFVGGCP